MTSFHIIRDSYEYRFEYNAANDYTTAAFIDLIGLELILPEDGADLGISVAMTLIPPLRGGRLGTKAARELIPGSLRRLKSYHEELADHTYDEIVRLSKGKGPSANAARQMKKLIEQAARLLEKGSGRPR